MTINSEILEREKYAKAFEQFGHVLTQNQSQIVHLYYIENLSLSEISSIVAITRSGVHDSLQKARKKLEPFFENIK